MKMATQHSREEVTSHPPQSRRKAVLANQDTNFITFARFGGELPRHAL